MDISTQQCNWSHGSVEQTEDKRARRRAEARGGAEARAEARRARAETAPRRRATANRSKGRGPWHCSEVTMQSASIYGYATAGLMADPFGLLGCLQTELVATSATHFHARVPSRT